MSDYVASYEHSPEELADTARATIEYIRTGDPLCAIYGLRGLAVYAVIGALREHDEQLHNTESLLDAVLQARLEEVETQVDIAVQYRMQFYPFGHDTSAPILETQDFQQLSANYPRGLPDAPRRRVRAHTQAL